MKRNEVWLRNWLDYNPALVARGRLTLWFAEKAKGSWSEQESSGHPSAPPTYADVAIQCVPIFRAVFRLTLPTSESLAGSLLERIDVGLPRTLPSKPVHMVIDASALMVRGECDSNPRQHELSKQRSLAETAMFRLRSLFCGAHLAAYLFEHQATKGVYQSESRQVHASSGQ